MQFNSPLKAVDERFSGNKSRIDELLEHMTLEEKIGQMSQFAGEDGSISQHLSQSICQGKVGSVLNEVDVQTVNELQRLAVEESRLGIPLLIGRDVIHGFKTIFPIPLGQAASWCPDTIEQCAHASAIEASSSGVNWTFAPMIDISRDPRWGRIAESLGEDTYLSSILGSAMVKGFQGDNLSHTGRIAACAKHFAGYGAAESGRDYNTTNIPENELRNAYLPPFKAVANAGVATFMSAFNDLNGVPATGNSWLMDDLLRGEWHYRGFVVSDWESVKQLTTHGFAENEKEAAFEAFNAGVDMEMVSTTYQENLSSLLEAERLDITNLDNSVRKILQLKCDLGLFENPYTSTSTATDEVNPKHLNIAKDAAIKSCVLLKNLHNILPISLPDISSLAIIGPLADDPYEQLGTWIFDGDPGRSETCLEAILKGMSENVNLHFHKGMKTSRSYDSSEFQEAVDLAAKSDIAVMVMGEESILSGEAHCRADIGLPGCQEQLINAVAGTGTPIVLVIMAGRPLTIASVLPKVDAVLYAWHPGSMGGPAIADLLLGKNTPSGKLPVTFPRKVGQIPIYYNQKHSGKPATEELFVHMDDIPVRAPQTSLGMSATHLDTHFSPLFPFGFGLSYCDFEFTDLRLSEKYLYLGGTMTVSVRLTNTSDISGDEIVQLYIRDLVGSVTRPVKELKRFKRISLAPKEVRDVSFTLHSKDLAFYGRNMKQVEEAGKFHLWVGSSSEAELKAEFELINE